MTDSALRPTFGMQDFIDTPKPQEEEPTVEEGILAVGAEKVFWKTLKKHFDDQIRAIEQINEAAIASGMSFEEIGRNALVISQVKGVIRKIVDKVEDAKEAADGRQK